MTLGVDEVGRGPLAGPVGVGVAMVSPDFDWSLIPGVTDSKKLTEAKREDIYKMAWQLRKAGQLDWSVALVSAQVIDKQGIQSAIKLAMNRVLIAVSSRKDLEPAGCVVKLDGGLKAPEEFLQQETIIKGDALEPTIGLASIVAKVTRDRYMVRQAQRAAFLTYDFATHKGYGTKSHRAAIKKYGLSIEHRASFCRNILAS